MPNVEFILIACASYWTIGPSLTYAAAGVATFALSAKMKSIAIKKAKVA